MYSQKNFGDVQLFLFVFLVNVIAKSDDSLGHFVKWHFVKWHIVDLNAI